MALIDEVSIVVEGGAGGNGCISFRREKYVPRGGPNGGNGGRGGHVTIRATHDKGSLIDFKYRPKFSGERGEHGMGQDCHGRGGIDLVIDVPVGTMIYDEEDGSLLCDLVDDGAEMRVAPGGRGGRGNLSYATSTNRAPRMSTPGEAGVHKKLRLELRLLADVGLIGFPNAGKSSFLRCISRATPKVADYPFTTLEPSLGVVEVSNFAFVMADLPGLIEGAAEGVGLGHKFLRHVSRNRILLHLADLSEDEDSIVRAVEAIRRELGRYDEALLEREEILLWTKADLMTDEEREAKVKRLAERGFPGVPICSHTNFNIPPLIEGLAKKIAAARAEEFAAKLAARVEEEEGAPESQLSLVAALPSPLTGEAHGERA